MKTMLGEGFALAALATAALVSASPPAGAQDFLSALFGAFNDAPAPEYRAAPMPYASEHTGVHTHAPRRSRPAVRARAAVSISGGGSGQAYCVRTCDGRYFPISASDNQSRAASCNSFCPATETKVFFGSTIENASSENGRQYSQLPNAFKYRKELVAGCTCNGKDQFGLASVKIENDPTLKRGDVVAGADGLMVSHGADRQGTALNMSPASNSVRVKYQRLPVLASQ